MSRNLIVTLLVLLFMYTGFSKVFALQTFSGALHNQPIPYWIAAVLTILIPLAEIATASCLLFKKSRRTGLYSALALLTIFTAYITAILLHLFPRIPCPCGAIFHGLSWKQHWWVNLILTGLTAIAILLKNKPSIPSPLNLLVL